MIEWLIAAAVMLGLLALLPVLLRRTARAARKPGGSGVVIAIGMVFAMIFDPKAVVATEQIQKRADLGEDEDSGDPPVV